MENVERGRILGIGGIFFKSANSQNLRDWYRDYLGMKNSEHGNMFHWRSKDTSAEHLTVWSIFPDTTTYFDPGKAPFMINYIVDDLDALLAKMKSSGMTTEPKREDSDYGRFAWVFDPEGNKIELWEPEPPSATPPSI